MILGSIVAHPLAGEERHRLGEVAGLVHGVERGKIDLHAERVVVGAVHDRGVHHPGAVLGGDEVGGGHEVGLLAGERGDVEPVLGALGDQRNLRAEERAVAAADEIGAAELAEDLVLAAQDLEAVLGQVVDLAPLAHLHVGDVLADGQRHVAGQRPGRGRPGQDEGAGLVLERELHGDRGIGDRLVALRDLVIGERGLAARAVGHDLEAGVEEPLVPEPLRATTTPSRCSRSPT